MHIFHGCEEVDRVPFHLLISMGQCEGYRHQMRRCARRSGGGDGESDVP